MLLAGLLLERTDGFLLFALQNLPFTHRWPSFILATVSVDSSQPRSRS
jgi:hypothetical protein